MEIPNQEAVHFIRVLRSFLEPVGHRLLLHTLHPRHRRHAVALQEKLKRLQDNIDISPQPVEEGALPSAEDTTTGLASEPPHLPPIPYDVTLTFNTVVQTLPVNTETNLTTQSMLQVSAGRYQDQRQKLTDSIVKRYQQLKGGSTDSYDMLQSRQHSEISADHILQLLLLALEIQSPELTLPQL